MCVALRMYYILCKQTASQHITPLLAHKHIVSLVEGERIDFVSVIVFSASFLVAYLLRLIEEEFIGTGLFFGGYRLSFSME